MQNKWTKEETTIAFNVYCKIPFKESSKNHPLIIAVANKLGRTPSALNMKIGNFGRLDPELKKKGITGLKNGSKLEEEVWNEFHGDWENLAIQSEMLLEKLIYSNDEVLNQNHETEKKRVIKARLAQSFFRSSILAAYSNKCCITGIDLPELLIASHIIPWAKSEKERLNPRNGLCLNALHDKAFDKGFITLDDHYRILISKKLKSEINKAIFIQYFQLYENIQISLPDKFLPNIEFLSYHRQNIYLS